MRAQLNISENVKFLKKCRVQDANLARPVVNLYPITMIDSSIESPDHGPIYVANSKNTGAAFYHARAVEY